MNARELIDKNFLDKFRGKGRNNIGVELEYPLLNLACAPVKEEVAHGLMDYLCGCGFQVEDVDAEGRPAFLINADHDVLSFDNSYNNFEFSMEKGTNLSELSARFYTLYSKVQDYLLARGHTLCAMGTNPYYNYIKTASVPYPVYGMVRNFLSRFSGGGYHCFPDFPAYLSSIQTHLDISYAALPAALTLFAALDFVRALLFSNSPAFPAQKVFYETVCFRDYLWEKSGFGSLHDNTGKVEGKFQNADDVIDAILERSMFNRLRHGKYELFAPVRCADYFKEPGREEDIETYLSFKNVEVTRRGTLEIRSDCTQPVREAFLPAAFHLGIAAAMEKAENRLMQFMQYSLPQSVREAPDQNSLLRNGVIYYYQMPAERSAVRGLMLDLCSIALDGLKSRGNGEETLLAPVFKRAERLTCPGREILMRQKKGEAMEKIIKDYSQMS